MSEDDLVIMPTPSLASVLLNRESARGSPLTLDEVVDIAGDVTCVAVPRDEVATIAAERGYDDIDPAPAWQGWSAIRPSLVKES